LEALIDEYLGRRTIEQGYASGPEDDPARRLCQRLLMRSEEPSRSNRLYQAYQAMTDLHAHKWMYDGRSLTKLMTEAGFVDCSPHGFRESNIPHIDKVEMPGRVQGGAGVIVEGAKPR
jgi:hypothetical protein